MIEDQAPLALKDILAHQEASESWIKRVSEESLHGQVAKEA